MDKAALHSILAEHKEKKVGSILVGAFTEPNLMKMDECVVEFLLCMLEGQSEPESYIPDPMILETLARFLVEFECCTAEEAMKKSQSVVDVMDKNSLIKRPDVDESAKKLATAVNIGKQYEDTLRRAQLISGAKIVVNTNDEWTYDARREAIKNERQSRKDEEKKAVMREEFEEFLRIRGVKGNAKVSKLHSKHTGANYSPDIRCEGIQIRMGKVALLEDTDLILLNGHRYGLVGKNGAGKTTLLRALSEGELEGVSPFVQILHVEQEIVGGGTTPLQVVLDSDIERSNLIVEEQELLKSGDPEGRLAGVYARMEEIDAHTAEARAATILSGLSFTTEMMREPTKLLSGGWRMRVALARALFIEPEVLLLDEPTNHLDLHAVLWLESFLQNWSKTFVVVSHSRTFLNAVCGEIVHLQDQKLSYYTGDYDQFEVTRCEQLRQQAKQYEAQQKQRQHMQAFVDRFRCNANRAKMAQSRLKALEKMELIGPVMAEAEFSFVFPDPDPAPSPYIQVIDAEFGYNANRTLFTDVNCSLDENSRIALVGANGAGKTTFLRMLLGMLEPKKGQVMRNQKVRVGHFAQHHLESLTPQLSSIEFMQHKFPSSDPGKMRAHLGSLGISGDRALQAIYTLSGGQKSRLALAWITWTKPHLLLLDEPTNHLDIDTVHALIQAVHGYQGGIMLVSHDEHFITSVCDELWVCGNGKLTRFDGDFNVYKAQIVKGMK